MKVLVGLGNPGVKYRQSRHNAGFMVMDFFAKSKAIAFRKSSQRLSIARALIRSDKRSVANPCDEDLILAKPQSYMNRSGPAILELLRETGAEVSDLVVIHDDLDLDLGRLQFKARGGHGGNRGIQSVVVSLQTQHFYRLRVGIGRPPASRFAETYVLSTFLSQERSIVKEVIERAAQALDCFIKLGPEMAMNRFNR